MRADAIAVDQNINNNDVFFDNPLLIPLQLGDIQLSHRVVLAPVTRCRALNYVPQEAHVEFYALRATAGGLLISEAVAVAQEGIGFPHSPGIWNEEQVIAWKKVVDAVHKRGGLIFCQLWHVGRASHEYYQPHGQRPVSSTSAPVPDDGGFIRLPDGGAAPYSASPRRLSTSDIPLVVHQFRTAARNAALAGFDGVEIHAGHGYLLDQFLKDGINDRSDRYGGSIPNRCRLPLEILDAVAAEIGGRRRTAVRISPVIDHLGATDSDPVALGLHLVSELNRRDMAYLHLTEPRFNNKGPTGVTATEQDCGVFQRAYGGTVIRSGGYTRESGMAALRQKEADLISYGRLFISNPDLVLRYALAAPLNPYDRSTFYTHDQVKGYLDYPLLTPPEIVDAVAAAGRRQFSRSRDLSDQIAQGMSLLRHLTPLSVEGLSEVERGLQKRLRGRPDRLRRNGSSCSSAMSAASPAFSPSTPILAASPLVRNN